MVTRRQRSVTEEHASVSDPTADSKASEGDVARVTSLMASPGPRPVPGGDGRAHRCPTRFPSITPAVPQLGDARCGLGARGTTRTSKSRRRRRSSRAGQVCASALRTSGDRARHAVRRHDLMHGVRVRDGRLLPALRRILERRRSQSTATMRAGVSAPGGWVRRHAVSRGR